MARPSSTLAAREDAHYFVVNNRRWRKTDPHIPSKLRAELVKELMSARRTKDRARVAAPVVVGIDPVPPLGNDDFAGACGVARSLACFRKPSAPLFTTGNPSCV